MKIMPIASYNACCNYAKQNRLNNSNNLNAIDLSTELQNTQSTMQYKTKSKATFGANPALYAIDQFRKSAEHLRAWHSDKQFKKILNLDNIEEKFAVGLKLTGMKDTKGVLLFDSFDVARFLPITNKKNMPILEKLIGMKDEKGASLFEPFELRNILPVCNKKNMPVVEKVAKMKDKDGSRMFTSIEMKNLLPLINQDNLPIFEKLAGMEHCNCQRFLCEDLALLMGAINKKNWPAAEKLLSLEAETIPHFVLGAEEVIELLHLGEKNKINIFDLDFKGADKILRSNMK